MPVIASADFVFFIKRPKFEPHIIKYTLVVEVNGKTVGDCLNNLIGQFPGFQEVLFAKSGKLQNWIEIYVNMESAYPEELAKPVKDGDEIHITIMLAGG